ncbi:hypothetical protein KJ682_07595 [bacterium]|nr:hypothetical protein [bacterium]
MKFLLRLILAGSLGLVAGNAAALNILLAHGAPHLGYPDVAPRLVGLGHTVTPGDPLTWDAAFDYEPYDVVAFQYDSKNPADLAHLTAALDSGQIGVVFFRAFGHNATVIGLGLMTTTEEAWQSPTDLTVLDNTHPITSFLSLGTVNLGFTYMGWYLTPAPEASVLATGPSGPALVVHDTRRAVLVPYFGHAVNHGAENETGLTLTQNALLWAANSGSVPDEAASFGSVKSLFR